MEPISLILAALAAGATAAAKDTAGTAVKDAYESLKALIKKKFAENTKAQEALKDYEEDTETYEKPFEKQLKTLEPNDRDEIKELAEKLNQVLKTNELAGSQPKFGGTFTAEKQVIQQGEKNVIDNISL
ncbi:hypothetical protein [Microcystis aeruginosa]|jgi:hypothetical protein|uniref:Uncharacterized protein n=1 Tax=Microcystis aeruginosa FD4 TaxID=2686288 RepID=A0A857D2A5_MICAE|nr:hypothetical protein [Microcystis aeruginosa]QGZ89938.1 hypothetical protein GQR42_10550 [Microcystis aeruginosa FD4]